MKIEPKFYKNLADNNHCLQAAVMIVLNTLGKEIEWDDVNRMTQYVEGLYSWAGFAALEIAKRISKTKLVSDLDYNRFAELGTEYLKTFWGPEWFELQKQKASPGFERERQMASLLKDTGICECRMITKEEIQASLKNHILIALVDMGLLSGGKTTGHFVVLYNQEGDDFFLHDPGLPPRQSYRARMDTFMLAFKKEAIIIPKGSIPFGADVQRNDPCWCNSGKKFKKCHGR